MVRTGVGPVRSRQATRRLREDPADLLVVAGLWRAVDPNLASGRRGRRLGAAQASALHLSPSRRSACAAPSRCRGSERSSGSILSVDHVVRGLEREAVFAEGAVAVDMESAWLAEAANGRPLGVVRVVLDAPTAEIHPLSMLKNGWRALAALRRLAPAFEIWASLDVRSHRRGPFVPSPH